MIVSALKSNLARSAGIYTVSNILNAAVPFLLLPVLTRFLTPSDYGLLAVYAALTGILLPFIGLNMHGAVSVKYFRQPKAVMSRYVGNCLMLLVASTVFVSGIVFVLAPALAGLTSFPRTWLWAVVAVAACQTVILILLTLWQADNKPVRYGVFQNLQTGLSFTLSLLFVVVLRMNWRGSVTAQLITVLVFSLIAGSLLYRGGWLKFTYDKSDILDTIKFGAPLIPHTLGGILIIQTDRVLLSNMVGVADTGIYTVGFQIGSVIGLLASSFNQSYSPWLFHKLSQDDFAVKRKIVKFTYVYFALILSSAVVLSLVTPLFIRYFVGKDFIGAAKYTFWLALGFAFSGMYYMVANYIFFAEKTPAIAWVTITTAALNIFLTYGLIRLNGAMGAAQASAFAFFLSFVLTWILSARVYSMPWDLRRRQAHAPTLRPH